MSANPGNSGGSISPPFLITRIAETRGELARGMTITRRPFASVLSTGFGKVTDRGGAGGGGVACGVCAETLEDKLPNASTRITMADLKKVPSLISLTSLLANGRRVRLVPVVGSL